MQLFSNQSGDPKTNAQRNLCGRTHYVDADSLRFHKSRIISAQHVAAGLLFAIVTSDAKDYEGRERGFRYVIFNLFGKVIERNPDKIDLEWFKSSARASKAMWTALNAMDARAITREAIERATRQHADEMAELAKKLEG